MSRPVRVRNIWNADDPIVGNQYLASFMSRRKYERIKKGVNYDALDMAGLLSGHFRFVDARGQGVQ